MSETSPKELGVCLTDAKNRKGAEHVVKQSSTTSATVLVELGEEHHGGEKTPERTQVQAHRKV